MEPYTVHQYSRQRLTEALANFHCSAEALEKHGRVEYLDSHLQGLSITSLVIENDYTDGDYLEDFSAYYSRCNTVYSSRCKRIHFFAEGNSSPKLYEPGRFEELIASRGKERAGFEALLQESYRGFAVARPLPYAVVGRTLLQPWDDEDGRRKFEVVSRVYVTLFGISLEVTGFPFQEQDSATAACATVALWSCLQHAGQLFRCQSPRAAALTQMAMLTEVSSRIMPNAGLTISQVCCAVRAAGLECEVFPVLAESEVRVPWLSIVQGYLRLKLPVLLVCSDPETHEWHALAVAGFGLAKDRQMYHGMEWKKLEVPSKSLWIEEFYAHDDQRGPYCHYHIDRQDRSTDVAGTPMIREGLVGHAQHDRKFCVQAVIIPVYAKIRVSYTDIYRILDALSALIEFVSGYQVRPGVSSRDFQWDTWLTTSTQLKGEWLSGGLTDQGRSELILSNLPRYIWRARCELGGKVLLELLVDATDMPRSIPLVACLWGDDDLSAAVQSSCRNPDERSTVVELVSHVLGHVLGTELIQQFAMDSHVWLVDRQRSR